MLLLEWWLGILNERVLHGSAVISPGWGVESACDDVGIPIAITAEPASTLVPNRTISRLETPDWSLILDSEIAWALFRVPWQAIQLPRLFGLPLAPR